MDRTTSLPGGIVTALFTDIVNSTELKLRMSGDTTARRDEEYRSTVRVPHDQRLLDLVARHGGATANSTGDGYLFVFTDAEKAVLCGLAIRDSLHADPIETPLGRLQLRVGS